MAAIVIQNDIFPVHAASEFGASNFYLRFFESRQASIRNRDSPQHCGGELRRLRPGVNVARLVGNFRRNSWTAGSRDTSKESGIKGEESETYDEPQQPGGTHVRIMTCNSQPRYINVDEILISVPKRECRN